MRIGLSTSMIQRGQSGVAQYVFALVKALIQQAPWHDLTLFVLKKDLPLFSFAKGAAEIVPMAETFRSPVKNILWHQTLLPEIAGIHRLDVLHIPSYRRMIWSHPCATVATIHDLAPFHVARKYDWKRMFYGRVVARRLAHRQHNLIAVSHNTQSDIVRYFGVAAEKIAVVHNGLDHERFYPESGEIARRRIARQYALRGSFFLYVARLEHPGKNHVRLIEAFNRFKAETKSDWQLVFAGGDWHGAEVIRGAITQSPFRNSIRSLGFVEDASLPMLYGAAEVFVYPSLFEGFGFPPLEAMACGCPVLCSTRGSLGEIVGQAAATVDPEDCDAIKMQMAMLAFDPARRGALREAGFARAQRFQWKRTALQTLEVYATAMEQRKAPAGIAVMRQPG